MIEERIIDKIISAWRAAAKSPEMTSSIPQADDLKALLEGSFLASIKQEEGRSLRFRLVFLPHATATSLSKHSPWIDALPFDSSLPFSVHTLRKLALAFDQDATGLVVNGSGGQYEVIGAMHYGRMTSRLERGGGRGRPHALTLSTRVSGSVIVGFGDSVVGRFQDGEFHLATPTWTGSLLVYHIIRHISGHDAYKKHGNEYWLLYRDCLERLYTTAVKFGHGGTIVWLLSERLEEGLKDIRGAVRIVSGGKGSRLAENILNRKANAQDSDVLVEYRGRLADHLDMISRLSCVDGAVIIDEELSPRCFGARLNSQWTGEVFEGPVGRTETRPGKSFDISRLGTRHQSAIQFAAVNSGCVVFVISEDGPVRAICRLEDAVLIWPDCLNTMFLDS